jgi:hypothetical protein
MKALKERVIGDEHMTQNAGILKLQGVSALNIYFRSILFRNYL